VAEFERVHGRIVGHAPPGLKGIAPSNLQKSSSTTAKAPSTLTLCRRTPRRSARFEGASCFRQVRSPWVPMIGVLGVPAFGSALATDSSRTG